MTEYKMFVPPKPVGFWSLGPHTYASVNFAMYVKPTDEHIKNTEDLLGWKWVDAKDMK
jgi:hypothetical protein